MSLGTDFQVNTYTAHHQSRSSIARLEGGGFVVTWRSDLQDGSGFGVYGQRYLEDGTPAGGEFHVSTFTTGNQSNPVVTTLHNGGFVVAWESDGQDGSGLGVYAQQYTAAGVKVGVEFRANTATANDQSEFIVTALNDGGYVIAWESEGQDGSGLGLYGHAYNSDGSAKTAEFLINTYTANNQIDVQIASLADGGFVATWNSFTQDGSFGGIFAQRYTSAGAKTGAEFQVNTVTAGEQTNPSVAGLNDGGFVVAWRTGDGSSSGIHAQRYDSGGNTSGAEVLVNTYTTDQQRRPSVTSLEDGGYVIVWESRFQDGSSTGIYGQKYTSDGTSVGGEFRIHTHTNGGQFSAKVDALTDGGFVVAWSSDHTGQRDSFAQVFHPSGQPYGEEIALNGTGSGSQYVEVTALSGAGFAASWMSLGSDGSGFGIEAVVHSAGTTIEGTAGADTLIGGSGADIIKGLDGDDTLQGGAGTDRLYGGSGADDFHFEAGGGLDIVYDFEDGIDTITFIGGDFADLIFNPYNVTDTEITSIQGGRMVLRNVTPGQLTESDFHFERLGVDGGANADTLVGTIANEQFSGGAGVDRITTRGGEDLIEFQPANGLDIVYDFENGSDLIGFFGHKFSDLDISVYNGADVEIRSDFGGRMVLRNVDIADFDEADFIFEETGNYYINGTSGSDTLKGSAGNDVISGAQGNQDRLYGNGGDDVFLFETNGGLDIVYDFEDGKDKIWYINGDFNDLSISVYNGVDAEIRSTEGGRMVLRNTAIADLTQADFSFADRDGVSGTAGADTLIGTDAHEVFSGGAGTDRFYGNGGTDAFEFQTAGGLDIVYDFEDGRDFISYAGGAFSEMTITAYNGTDANIVSDAGGRMVLRNVAVADLTAEDFLF